MIPIDAAQAAGDAHGVFREMVVVLAAGAAFTWLSHRLRLVPIVGFLAAGVLIGPDALALVESRELIDGMAEVGVILLLFTIGIEFSLRKLALIRRFILIGGGLQVGFTIALTAAVLIGLGIDARLAIYTGCLAALSSTVIVLKLHADEGTTDTPAGRIGLGVLIFQDLAVIAMVLFVPILGGEGTGPAAVALALGQSIAIIAIVLLLAAKTVPGILDRVARIRSPELFLITVMLICFGIAWLTSLGGVSLSLGAFLAGLVVSGSRFREHAVGEILPLRTLFNAVFFVSVGMLLDPGFVAERPLLVALTAATVFFGKAILTAAAVLVLRYPVPLAAAVGLALAQIGEFSFVLEGVGREAGLSPAGLGEPGRQTFLAVTVLLMAVTPLTRRLEPRLEAFLRRRPGASRHAEEAGPGPAELSDHVIIGGYGLAGRAIETALARLAIPHVVVDLNPISVMDAEAAGVSIVYGDLTHPGTLSELNAAEARLVVIAINDPDAAQRAAQRLHMEYPGLEVIVRVRYAIDATPLREIGAEVVIVEEVESAVHLLEETLHGCGVDAGEVALQLERLRAGLERS